MTTRTQSMAWAVQTNDLVATQFEVKAIVLKT